MNRKTLEAAAGSREVLLTRWARVVRERGLLRREAGECDAEAVCDDFLSTFFRMAESESAEDSAAAGGCAPEEHALFFASRGMSFEEALEFVGSLKAPLFETLFEAVGAPTAEALTCICDAMDRFCLRVFAPYLRDGAGSRREETEPAVPVLRVWDGVLAVALSGDLSSQTARPVTEKLLETIAATASRAAVVDLAGIPDADEHAVCGLLKTLGAVRLLGAEPILTGIAPAVARTLVRMGADLTGIVTAADLAGGIRKALELKGYRLCKIADADGQGNGR